MHHLEHLTQTFLILPPHSPPFLTFPPLLISFLSLSFLRDGDTETRNFSPVFFNVSGSVDVAVPGFDHGWCFSYSCLKRVSNFFTYIPTGDNNKAIMWLSTPFPFISPVYLPSHLSFAYDLLPFRSNNKHHVYVHPSQDHSPLVPLC